MSNPELVLASGSPYRRQLLDRLGLDFAVDVPQADERALAGEDPAALVTRLAQLKARTVAARRPGAVSDRLRSGRGPGPRGVGQTGDRNRCGRSAAP